MGILEIGLIIAGILGGIALGALGAVAAVAALSKPELPTQEIQFQAPRSGFGEPIGFVFGNVQIRSPICIYFGPVKRGDPYNKVIPGKTEGVLVQYRATADLVICKRMRKDGATLGEITLKRIWYGDQFLWDFPDNFPPVKTSGTLLSHDPPGYSMPGGVTDPFTRGGGWWYGGCMGDKPVPSGGPYVASASGPLLGDFEIADADSAYPYPVTAPFTKGLGMERVRFYAGQAGTEEANWQIINEKQIPPSETIPTYPRLARLVFEDFVWGPEARVADISVEVIVSCPAPEIGDSVGLMWNGLDVNPISVLYQLFTCKDFSGAGKLPPPNIETFTAARAAIESEQLGMSYRLQAVGKLEQLVQHILKHVDGILYEDPVSGETCIALNRPVSEAPPVFSDKHTISVDDISKTTWEATVSQVRANFEMRNLAANEMGARNVAVAKDPGLSESQGSTETLDEEIPTAYDPAVAQSIVQRRLSMANTPLLKGNISFNRLEADEGGISMSDMRPGKVFAWSHRRYNLPQTRLRCMSVHFGELESNAIKIGFIEDKYTAPSFITPPGETDTGGPPGLETATVADYEVITAPYYMARRGLGADARFALTTAPLYQISSDTEGLQFATNFDRFLALAKRPYSTAQTFVWSLFKVGGLLLEAKETPYTEAGQLADAVLGSAGSADGIVPEIQITGLDNPGVIMLLNAPCFLLIGQEWFQTDPANATQVDAVSVTVENVWRAVLDSPEQEPHAISSLVWVCEMTEAWALARLSAPYESSREEYFIFDEADLTTAQAHYDDFQTLTFEAYSALINVDSSRQNIAIQTANQFLQDRANRCLPIRKPDLATGIASVDAAEVTFAFDFEQLTAVPRLYQQRELAPYPDFGGPAFSLLLPPFQTDGEGASVERIPGVLSEALEDFGRNVAKLEVWYQYETGPLAGVLRRSNNVTDAGSGSASFAATAESTTRVIECYLRTVFAPHVLGDAGRVPIRYSRARTVSIVLTRT